MTDTVAAIHPFDEAVRLTAAGEGRYTGNPHPAYANMVGPFGGVTAATLLQAVLHDPRRLGEVLSLTVNYAGPLADKPFDIVVNPTRTNRSTQHWNLALTQDDAITTTATAVFGVRHETWSSTELALPSVPGADDVPVYPMPELVAWTRNYEMRYVEGAPPEADAGPRPESSTTMWVRDFPGRPLDLPALTALSDVFYPRVFRRLGAFVPAGTVSLTTHFHAAGDVLAEQGDRPVLASARAAHFGGGYFDQSARLWSEAGQPLATSHQLVYFKA